MSNHDHQFSIISNNLMHHQQRIDEFSKESANLKLEITDIRNDIRKIFHEIKNINTKFIGVEALATKIDKLEKHQKEQLQKINLVRFILKMACKLWWLWLLILFCIFAFDVEIKVQNPHLVTFVTEMIKNRL